MFNYTDKAKRALIGLSLGHFTLDMYAAILIPLYPFIAQKLSINIAAISLVIAIGHSVSSVLQPVFGYFSDKLNHRIFMFFGMIFASVFVPLGLKAPNAFVLTICLMLGMIGNALYHPQVTAMIKDFFRENFKLSQALGIFLGCGTIGYAIGPYLSTYIFQTYGEDKYVYTALLGLILSFFVLVFVPKLEKKKFKIESNFFEAIYEIITNKACLFLIFITVIKAALTMSYGTYIPFLLKEHGYKVTNIGLLVTLFYIAGAISMMLSSKLEKKTGLKGVIVWSYLPLLPLTALFIYLLKIHSPFAPIVIVITGFFILLTAGVVLAHAQSMMTKHVGMISGIIQGFTLALGSLMLIPSGMIGEKFGVPYILILISSIAFLTSIYTLKTKLID